MRIIILADDHQKEEWLSKPRGADIDLKWVANEKELLGENADAYFNLLFEDDDSDINNYSQIGAPVFLNEVVRPFATLEKIKAALFRINAWPGFLKREIIEISASDPKRIQLASDVLLKLAWNHKFVPDIPGFITARVIATVINEAYFTLQQEVSTKSEIDIAMKLGTNYPHGPFEWSEMIGLEKIYHLLVGMSSTDKRYLPAERLRIEAEQQMTWH